MNLLNLSSKGSKETIRKRVESGQNKILSLNKSDEKDFPSSLFRPFPLLLTLSSEYSNNTILGASSNNKGFCLPLIQSKTQNFINQ